MSSRLSSPSLISYKSPSTPCRSPSPKRASPPKTLLVNLSFIIKNINYLKLRLLRLITYKIYNTLQWRLSSAQSWRYRGFWSTRVDHSRWLTLKGMYFANTQARIISIHIFIFLFPRIRAYDREENLLPYMPEIPLNYEFSLNYYNYVYNIRGIVTSPTGLESTGLVFAYGLGNSNLNRINTSLINQINTSTFFCSF